MSDSSEDAPLIPRATTSQHDVSNRATPMDQDDAKTRENEESEESDSSSSDDEPLVPAKRSINSRLPRKRRAQFLASDEDDSDEERQSPRRSAREPVATSRITRPPSKRQRLHEGPTVSTSDSGGGERAKKPARNGRSAKKNTRRKKSGTTSRPRAKKRGSSKVIGFAARDVNPPSNYEKKPGIIPLQSTAGALKWWEQKDSVEESEFKWTTLDHNGVVFPDPYQPHGVKMLYDGAPVDLTPDQEELATMYSMKLETDWVTKPKFRENFMREFKALLRDPSQERKFPEITDLSLCEFRAIYDWTQQQREELKERKKDPEYKAKLKRLKEESDERYGWAIVDGVRERVGNYKVEPPGLFLGRGDHPKMGQVKKRLRPEDVILNISRNTAIPPCPVAGHRWGGIIHDNTVTYIAKWIENINQQHKFVHLAASSKFKGQADCKKYNKARVLKSKIVQIRRDYDSKMRSDQTIPRQLATAVWIIDRLSIRVGNEKDTDEEADTVGVCSFRREHMSFGDDNKITLDFLGKDSMRYHQTIAVPELVFNNLRSFCTNKKPDQKIFEKIDPTKVNTYLSGFMEGLSAKVFRTHNASVTLQEQLALNTHERTGDLTPESPLQDKIFFYNQCNMQVAILCNHQRTVSKSHSDQMKRLEDKITEAKEQLEELKYELAVVRGEKQPRRSTKTPPKKKRSEQTLMNMIGRKEAALRTKILNKALKQDTTEVALGTSKINYMDPRITVAWCKKMEVPIERVFNKSLLDKFPWAMAVEPEYVF